MALTGRPLVAVLAVVSAAAAAGCDLTALLPGVARQSRDDGYYACLNIPPGVAHALHDPKQAARTAEGIRTMLRQTLPQDDVAEALKGCASALHVPVSKLVAGTSRGGAGVVSATGAVGPLRIDRSTPAQILAFAGRPEYTGAGRFRPLIREFAPFVAFGYGCRRVRVGGIPTMSVDKSSGMAGDSHVDCDTIYWLNRRTGRLAGFSTRSRRFHTPAGSRSGMSLAEAKRREHRPRLMEDPSAIHVASANADLLLYATIVVPKHGGWRVGKRLAFLALESKRHLIGLEFV